LSILAILSQYQLAELLLACSTVVLSSLRLVSPVYKLERYETESVGMAALEMAALEVAGQISIRTLQVY
jgi:hypothetical protein